MPDRACTFCGSVEAEVSALVAGPGVYICDGCVGYAGSVVREAASADPVRPARPGPSASTLGCSFCDGRPGQIGRLVAGPDVRICDQCLLFCDNVLAGRA